MGIRLQDFVGAERYPHTRAAIETARPRLPPEAEMELFIFLMMEGEKAKRWSAAPDPSEMLRADDAAFLESLPRLCEAARLLAEHFEQGHWRHNVAALGLTLLELRHQHGIDIQPADPKLASNPAEAFATILRTYGENLEKNHTARGNFLHRYTRGPFLNKGASDRLERADTLLNGLLFEATLWARRVSGAEGPLGPPIPMPTEGRALWKVAVAFVRDVTGQDIGEKQARDRLTNFLNDNPGVGWSGWPEGDSRG